MTIGSTVNAYRASEGLGAQKRQGFSRKAEDAEPNESNPDVLLDISEAGKQQSTNGSKEAGASKEAGGKNSDPKGGVNKEHTPEEKEQIEKLKARDTEVRAHEAAHMAAAGQYAKGGATYTYQRGPDGKQYAIGGEVQIDTSPVPGDPEATVRKMQQIVRAAHAPADPSGADQAVAASAAKQASEAQSEKVQKQSEEAKGKGDKSKTGVTSSSTSSPTESASAPPKKVTSSATAAAYSASAHMSSGSCTCKTCATYIPGPGISLAA